MEAISRLLSVLVSFDQTAELSLAEVSRRTSLDKATALRYLVALEAEGLIERDVRSRVYRLGLRLFQLGQVALRSRDVPTLVLPTMRDLAQQYRETVNLAVLSQRELILIQVVEGPQSIRKGASIGEREQLHSTSLGKAVLAELEPEYVDPLVGNQDLPCFTTNTIESPAGLQDELRLCRCRGYAIDNEETEQGLRCVGVALRGHNDFPRYAISISGPAERLPVSKLHQIGQDLALRVGALQTNNSSRRTV